MYDTFRFLIGLSKLKEMIIEGCIKFSWESEFSRQVNCILHVTCIISAEIQYKSRKKQVNKSEVTSIKIFQIIGRDASVSQRNVFAIVQDISLRIVLESPLFKYDFKSSYACLSIVLEILFFIQ